MFLRLKVYKGRDGYRCADWRFDDFFSFGPFGGSSLLLYSLWKLCQSPEEEEETILWRCRQGFVPIIYVRRVMHKTFGWLVLATSNSGPWLIVCDMERITKRIRNQFKYTKSKAKEERPGLIISKWAPYIWAHFPFSTCTPRYFLVYVDCWIAGSLSSMDISERSNRVRFVDPIGARLTGASTDGWPQGRQNNGRFFSQKNPERVELPR